MGGSLKAVLTLVCFAFSPFALGQAKLENPWLHQLVLHGTDLTWRQDYGGADSVFEIIARDFPDHPAGFLYRAGVALSFAEDHELLLNRPRFDSLIEIGRQKAGEMIARGRDKKWGRFFLATADGSDSYARVYGGDWVGGTIKGVASVRGFEEALGLDSTLSDACAGIGGYNYWRSKKTRYINWLPFVGDARPQAFLMLQRAIESGTYNRFTAVSMLATIYTDAERFEDAIECARFGLKHYPMNRTFLWEISTAFDRMGKSSEASQSYTDLLASIDRDPAGNPYNALVCRLNLAEALARVSDGSQARAHLTIVLQARVERFPEHLQARVRKNLERARLLEKKLSSQVGDGK